MKLLKELRQKKGLTQAQLARVLCVSQTMISQYEKGERTPTLKRAKVLAGYLGVSLDDLMAEDNREI